MTVQQIRDDKNVVTTVAFKVDDRLLGTHLAKPYQRGIAMLVDAFFVLLLTDASPMFWALFASIAFFKAGKQVGTKSWRLTRWLLRWGGAFAIFLTTLVIVSSFIGDDLGDKIAGEITQEDKNVKFGKSFSLQSLGAGVKFTTLVTQLDELDPKICDLNCFDDISKEIVHEARFLEVKDAELVSLLDKSYPVTLFETETHKQAHIDALVSARVPNSESETEETTSLQAVNSADEKRSDLEAENKKLKQELKNKESSKPNYSLVEFIMTQIEDLGLGFGWAALYFTAFSAWWRGQTPGKKLMGIRVVQLDGTYMSVWDSFERYGGYGAGFATGLLGFIQIFWDSNRQAIHDKISATVVIKGDLPDSLPKQVYKEEDEAQSTEQIAASSANNLS